MAVAFSGGTMNLHDKPWPWFAILAKSGKEGNATLVLENIGYECYLPVTKLVRRWSDRVKQSEVPLFPGYFFCRMDPHNRLPVLMTPGVIQIVGIGKTPVPVEEQEIAAIQRAGKSGISITPWPYMEVGNIARIQKGPLQGMTGIVVRIKSVTKLVLSVSLLQRSVAVEIDRAWISEAVAAPPAASTLQHDRPTPIPIDPSRLNATIPSKPTEAN
ncbi:MAG TPA: transcription termination/antitermination NusG family protein [Candidatus Acidoferrum sp.]|jgi:transcription antitermination factor NusG